MIRNVRRKLLVAAAPFVLAGAGLTATVAVAPTADAARVASSRDGDSLHRPVVNASAPFSFDRPSPKSVTLAAYHVPASAPAAIPIPASTPASTWGTACLSASDGTRTCDFTTQVSWKYPSGGLSGAVHATGIWTRNNAGRCIQVTSIRYYYADGSYSRLGDAGGQQMDSTGQYYLLSLGWPFTSSGGDAYTAAPTTVTVSVAACSRPGLNGTTSTTSGTGT
jgi:hypothetical protein